MRLRIAIPEEHVNPAVIDAGLEAVTRLDEQLIKAGKVPLFDEALVAGRVRWQPEPPGQEHFDHAGIVNSRGWGDCDDLAPWAAATERVTGRDPSATARITRSGATTWHARVHRADGSVRDPSIEAGMGSRVSGMTTSSIGGIDAPLIAPMFGPGRGPSLAVARHGGGLFEARADLPMRAGSGYSYSATVLGYDEPSMLLHHAIAGVSSVGYLSGYCHADDLAHLFVANAIVQGATPRAALFMLQQAGGPVDADNFHRAVQVGEAIRCGGCCA